MTTEGLRAIAIVAVAGFPFQTGALLPASSARYLLERSKDGPWAERLFGSAVRTTFADGLAALGFKSGGSRQSKPAASSSV